MQTTKSFRAELPCHTPDAGRLFFANTRLRLLPTRRAPKLLCRRPEKERYASEGMAEDDGHAQYKGDADTDAMVVTLAKTKIRRTRFSTKLL